MLENIIGVEEAARILNLSSGTIKNKCAAGELPAKKIGKTWVLDKTLLTKETDTMKELNYTKISGRYYKLPEGYYALSGRFGDQVYRSDNGLNVTSRIMGNAKADGYILSTDKGIVHLELMD